MEADWSSSSSSADGNYEHSDGQGPGESGATPPPSSASPSTSPPLRDNRRVDPSYVCPLKVEGDPSVRMKTRSRSQHRGQEVQQNFTKVENILHELLPPPLTELAPSFELNPGVQGVEEKFSVEAILQKAAFTPRRLGRPPKKASCLDPPLQKREKQYCTLCRNHNVQAPKKRHTCPFSTCSCLLCELQKKAQMTMRHQQRLWRHKKFMLRNSAIKSSGGVLNSEERAQLCDMCRNHNELVIKKNHVCPFNKCKCQFCSLTFKRRELMKHLQKVRRSKLITDTQSSVALHAVGEKPKDMEATAVSNFGSEEEEEDEFFCDDGETNSSLGTETPADQFTRMMLTEDKGGAHGVMGDHDASGDTGISGSHELSGEHGFTGDDGLMGGHGLRGDQKLSSDHAFSGNQRLNRSPPPLIPFSVPPPEHMSSHPYTTTDSNYNNVISNNNYNYNNSNDYNNTATNNVVTSGFYKDCGSPPSLCPLYEDEHSLENLGHNTGTEETVLQASSRILNQTPHPQFSQYSHSYTLLNNCPNSTTSSLEVQPFAPHRVNQCTNNFSNGMKFAGHDGSACAQFGSGDASWPLSPALSDSSASFQGSYQNNYEDKCALTSKPEGEPFFFNKLQNSTEQNCSNQHGNVFVNLNCNF